MENSKFYSRRQMIKSTAALAGLAPLAPWWEVFGAAKKKPYRIGACDWSLGKGSAVEALAVARQIGLDGVQVSLGTAANDMHLRRPDIQQAYRDAARSMACRWRAWPSASSTGYPINQRPKRRPG